MEAGPVKDELKRIALEMLAEYEQEGGITHDLRLMFETMVAGSEPPHQTRDCP